MTEKGGRGNQPVHLLANMARHPHPGGTGDADPRVVAADDDPARDADAR
jgi:hypothetical protein